MKPLITVLTAVVMSITACGDSGSDATGTGDVPVDAQVPVTDSGSASSFAWLSNPCGLIGDQEMSELLPNPVAGSVITRGLCEYGPVDLQLGRVDVEIFVQDVSATGCDLFFSVGGFNSAEPVDAIGSAARWKGNGGTKQLGGCTSDDKAFAITLYDPDQATDGLATARAVGELLVTRLAGK